MYGTIFRMKVKSGKERELLATFEEWERKRKPKVAGAIASLMLKSDNVRVNSWGWRCLKTKRVTWLTRETPSRINGTGNYDCYFNPTRNGTTANIFSASWDDANRSIFFSPQLYNLEPTSLNLIKD